MNTKGDAVLERYGSYFETIGNTVAKALPRGWRKAWLQVEMDGNNGSVACFYRRDGNKAEQCELPASVFKQFYEMRRAAMHDDPRGIWSTLTFILDSDDTFHVDYGYEPAPVEGMFARRMAWREQYLKT
jgi:hypothetical protein